MAWAVSLDTVIYLSWRTPWLRYIYVCLCDVYNYVGTNIHPPAMEIYSPEREGVQYIPMWRSSEIKMAVTHAIIQSYWMNLSLYNCVQWMVLNVFSRGTLQQMQQISNSESESESESQYLLSHYKFTRIFVWRCTVRNAINNRLIF